MLEFGEETVENLAGVFDAEFDWIIAVIDELWLDNWHDVCGLAIMGILGEDLAVGVNSFFARAMVGHLEGGAPLREASTHVVIFGEAFWETS